MARITDLGLLEMPIHYMMFPVHDLKVPKVCVQDNRVHVF